MKKMRFCLTAFLLTAIKKFGGNVKRVGILGCKIVIIE